MKKTVILGLILVSTTANADSFKVCIGIKNICNKSVKLFTETISADRVEGLYRCQVLKSDCNEMFSNIFRPRNK